MAHSPNDREVEKIEDAEKVSSNMLRQARNERSAGQRGISHAMYLLFRSEKRRMRALLQATGTRIVRRRTSQIENK